MQKWKWQASQQPVHRQFGLVFVLSESAIRMLRTFSAGARGLVHEAGKHSALIGGLMTPACWQVAVWKPMQYADA